MIAIINYEAGNLTSVKRALDYLNIPNIITKDPTTILNSQAIIFPGVGAAGSAMSNLIENNLDKVLHQAKDNSIPILGICLGSQIVLEVSEENNTKTLGLIPGKCKRFSPDLKDQDGNYINIPHMGWNSVSLKQECILFDNIESKAEFYFVHSYYPAPEKNFILGTTKYGLEFCSVLGKDRLWAVQFHPEKSGRPGLKLLENFYNYARRIKNA
ncbi:glutamine amidotransferase [Desulfonauticus submarinus]|uniref:Imidazole glycerol phosphate synthase subunit HisH n=1 Tax=Desulfonauticus submarinus TaxID=206665 RepID=A0A1H0B4S4_9BACT|nr:imidazole glycerol phosphate synthase subunit HisH [Desulfonauticus submarinus]SDN40624.1 glutamine amidotransferase [Desulfonauticus submarinus]